MDTGLLKTRLRDWIWRIRINKKAHIWVMTGVILVLLILLLFSLWWVNKKTSKNTDPATENVNLTQVNISATPSKMRRLIDGVMVEKGKENFFPYAVMIENLVSVRPQTGLQAANVVYEALAEGGITRFLAVYATDELIREIGPVRSARPYFVTLAEEYQGMFLHVGGSPEAINQARVNDFLADLDAIGADGKYFWRDESMAAPHNLYTSGELISYARRDKNLFDKEGIFSPWKFSSPTDKKIRPQEEKKISFTYYGEDYNVEYLYNREYNVYYRFNGGEEHHDRLTGKQLQVRNVVVQFVPTNLSDEKTGRLNIELIGEGRAVIFNNGLAKDALWKKISTAERTRFFDSTNTEIEFTPGNIWIELLPLDRNLKYN